MATWHDDGEKFTIQIGRRSHQRSNSGSMIRIRVGSRGSLDRQDPPTVTVTRIRDGIAQPSTTCYVSPSGDTQNISIMRPNVKQIPILHQRSSSLGSDGKDATRARLQSPVRAQTFYPEKNKPPGLNRPTTPAIPPSPTYISSAYTSLPSLPRVRITPDRCRLQSTDFTSMSSRRINQDAFDAFEREFEMFKSESQSSRRDSLTRQLSQERYDMSLSGSRSRHWQGEDFFQKGLSLIDDILSDDVFGTSSMFSHSRFDGNLAGRREDRRSLPPTGKIKGTFAKAKEIITNVLAGKDLELETDSGYSETFSSSAGFTLTPEEISSRIKTYNSTKTKSNSITISEKDRETFQGFVQVCLCIEKPINMLLSHDPPSIYEALERKEGGVTPPTTVPIILPKNTVMGLHINSRDTAENVVGTLLNKFKIADNPRNFALFEQALDEDEQEINLRKVGCREKPLLSYLRWNTEMTGIKRFVLRENHHGEIMWEAFSIPELENFIKILDREERERINEIRRRYMTGKKHMETRLKELGDPT